MSRNYMNHAEMFDYLIPYMSAEAKQQHEELCGRDAEPEPTKTSDSEKTK